MINVFNPRNFPHLKNVEWIPTSNISTEHNIHLIHHLGNLHLKQLRLPISSYPLFHTLPISLEELHIRILEDHFWKWIFPDEMDLIHMARLVKLQTLQVTIVADFMMQDIKLHPNKDNLVIRAEWLFLKLPSLQIVRWRFLRVCQWFIAERGKSIRIV